jgi:hypothetical protein
MSDITLALRGQQGSAATLEQMALALLDLGRLVASSSAGVCTFALLVAR